MLCACCCLVPKLCWTLFDPVDWSLPGSSVHGISQARLLEWVAISFSRGSSWPRAQTQVSCIGGSHQGCPLCAYLPSSSYFIWGVFLWVELHHVLHFTNCYLPSAVEENYGMFLKNTANGVYSGHISHPHIALCYLGEVKICLPGTVFPEPNVSRCSRYNSSYFTNHSLSHPESLGYTIKFKISYPGCSCPMFHFQ